ncbi:MAG: hypothetical protein PHR43_02850 [Dehalococcoidales bacterium]|nr:hypothetical protein [Dehalococcoidales bacterium]
MVKAQVDLYDTTLRDGAQSEGISFSVVDKLNIVRKLDELGIHYIEGGYPSSNPKDSEFYEKVKGLTLKNSVVAAFGSTRRPKSKTETDINIMPLVNSGARVVTIVGKSWAQPGYQPPFKLVDFMVVVERRRKTVS